MADPRPLLVVDDEPHIWHLLQLNFASLGFTVQVAPTLTAARALLATGGPFAAVLLDLGLPDGSGLDLLREWAGRPPAPVLVLTGEIEDEILNEVRALGAVILSKPFSPTKLTAQVATLVRGRTRENA